MPDSYLLLARDVLQIVQTPLTPGEILDVARDKGLLPLRLHGKTQHKTLQARLSEDILHYKDASQFYRTSPGRFFLRCLLHEKHIPETFRYIYRAQRRQKTLYNENVLVVPKPDFERLNLAGFHPNVADVLSLFSSNVARYVDRKSAEQNYALKQIATYIVVVRGSAVLTYRRGRFTRAARSLQGLLSIGFGGHIEEDDLDLLNIDPIGAYKNACRELLEELSIKDIWISRNGASPKLKIIGAINDESTEEGKKHVGIVFKYLCDPEQDPIKGELSINELRWQYFGSRVNNIDEYENWSQHILQEYLYE